MMDGARDANPRVRYNTGNRICGPNETMAPIVAQIYFMMSIRDLEGLREFARSGAKALFIVDAAAFFHQLNPANRFKRAN
jgi:hypothetical protein